MMLRLAYYLLKYINWWMLFLLFLFLLNKFSVRHFLLDIKNFFMEPIFSRDYRRYPCHGFWMWYRYRPISIFLIFLYQYSYEIKHRYHLVSAISNFVSSSSWIFYIFVHVTLPHASPIFCIKFIQFQFAMFSSRHLQINSHILLVLLNYCYLIIYN